MQLSKRMELLASKVTDGNRLADVGTDHGYIPIALVQRGKIPSAIAMDVNRGPLERAKEHIRAYGLDTYIDTRLSDGLQKLSSGEADTVLIAGMGGMLMVRILTEGLECLGTVRELILQPQSEINLVRKWLYDNGFRIVEEDIVKDDGKYYPMMKALHEEADPGTKPEALSEAEFYYGSAAHQKSLGVFAEFLTIELHKNEHIVEILRENRQEASMRMEELRAKRQRMEEILQEVTCKLHPKSPEDLPLEERKEEQNYEMQ